MVLYYFYVINWVRLSWIYQCYAQCITYFSHVNCYHDVQIYFSSVGNLQLTVKTYVKDTSLSCELDKANMFWPNGGVVLVGARNSV